MNKEQTADFFSSKIMFKEDKRFKAFTLSSPKSSSGESPHSHDYMQIWYVTRGVVEHWIENKEYRLVKGDSFIMPPFITHRTILQSDASIICCEFSLDSFPIQKEDTLHELQDTLFDLSFMNYFLTDEKNLKPKFTVSPENQTTVEHLMYSILREYESDMKYSDHFVQLYVMQILLIYAREYCSVPDYENNTQVYNKYKGMIQQALSYMEENYQSPITLDDVCHVSMISRTYFCYLFKMMTGQTFISYLSNIRIKHAAALLETTDLPITSLCYDVGFNDLTHFSRTFKKLMGVPAREYRALKRNKPLS